MNLKKKQNRGYFGVAVYHPKTAENIGVLLRTAHNLGAKFVATIGKRYKKQPSDTTNFQQSIPLFHFETFEEFKKFIPNGCNLTAIEIDETARFLGNHCHSEKECYLLGAEDYGIPKNILQKCTNVVKLSSERCLNVAVAGSIVLYDRVGL